MNEDVFEVRERTEYRYLVQDEDEEEVQYVRHRHYINPILVLSRRCIALICLGVVALLCLAAYLGYVAQTLPPGIVQVATDCGEFRGRHKNGAYSFKGMPYAAPPVGGLRWAPPAPPLCRKEVTDAGRFRSMCPQVRPLSNTGSVMGQEDCLFINVWTPTLQPDSKLPVMVWIHGGYLHMLSGGEAGYSPTEKLAADTRVVYVSFNYRLNAFGFLALEMLREGSPKNTSGNYGFLDQIAALKWVQRNIHLFGGDPEKVTIFGQSSGGTSVWTLMMSPLAKGLFSAAVDMSGSYVYNASLQEAETDNLVFLKKTGCTDVTCLRHLSISQILQAIPWQEYPSWAADDLTDLPLRGHFIGPVAVVDGYVLEDLPFEIWEKKGNFSDVPFVVGTTEQEVDFSPPVQNMSLWTWGDYRWFVTEKLRSFSENLTRMALDLYPSSAPCPTKTRCPERAYTTMVSDLRATCPNNDLASRAAGRMVANLKMRYTEESSEWMYLNKAAFLDPQFSRLVHLSLEKRNLVSDSLSHEMENDTDSDCAQEGQKAATALGAMGSLFGDLYNSSDFRKDSSDVILEMQAYMKETPLSADEALDSPVYRYVVTHTPSGPVNTSSGLLPFPSRFSFHMLDTLAFFGGLESALGKPLSDKDQKFQDLITHHLVHFATTGKMEYEWPEYPVGTVLLSHQLSVNQSYSAAQCQLWKENGLYAYAWMN